MLWSVLHQGAGRAATFLFFASLPWLIPLEAVGHFSLTWTALLLLLQPAFDSALGLLLVKAIARGDRERAGAALRQAARAFLPAAILAGVIVVALGANPGVTGLLVLGLGLSLPLQATFALSRGEGALELEGSVGTLQKLALLPLAAALHAAGVGGEWLPALALLFSALVGWLLLGALFAGRLRALGGLLNVGATAPGLGREAALLTGTAVAVLLYQRLDLFLLGSLREAADVGRYATAVRWAEIGYVAAHALMLVAFPRLAASAPAHRPGPRGALAFGALGLVVGAGVWSLGRWIAPLAYGANGAAIGGLVTALAPSVPAVFVGAFATQSLVAADRSHLGLKVALVGLGANLAVALVAIPAWGARGAALATVVTEAVIALAALLLLHRLRPGLASGAPEASASSSR